MRESTTTTTKQHAFAGGVPELSKSTASAIIVSKTVGFALILSGVFSVILILFAMLPHTKLENGIPVVNEAWYFAINPVAISCILFLSMTAFGYHSSISHSTFEPTSGKGVAMRSCLSFVGGGIFGCVLPPIIIQHIFDVPLAYYTFGGIPFVLLGLGAAIFIDSKVKIAYANKRFNDARSEIPKGESAFIRTALDFRTDKKKVREKKGKEKSIFDIGTNFLTLAFAFFYMIALVPVYELLGDTGRIFYVVFLHGAFAEVNLFTGRAGTLSHIQDYLDDMADEEVDEKELIYRAAVDQWQHTFNETFFAFVRRTFIANMLDPLSTTLAIILCGFEEVILRSTLKQRDAFVSATVLKRKVSQNERNARIMESVEEKTWQVSIGGAMLAEVFSILVRFMCTVILWQHRHIFSLGFPDEQSDHMMFFNLALEVFSEVIVDALAVYTELVSGIQVDQCFAHILCPANVLHMGATLFAGTFMGMFIFVRIPKLLFCKEASVCSCDISSNFRAYKDLCNQTSANVSAALDIDSLASDLDQDEMAVLVIGVISFIGVAAIAVAATFYWRHRRQSKVTADLMTEVSKKEKTLKKLKRLMDSEKQALAIRAMEEEKYAALRPYQIPNTHIKYLEIIGAGTFGEVWHAKYRDRDVAIKKIVAGTEFETELTTFRKEAHMMALLQGSLGISHANLVQMLHCCWEDELLLLLEYFPEGSLADLLERKAVTEDLGVLREVSWTTVDPDTNQRSNGALFDIALDIASGMDFIHSFDPPVIHRDLKPGNVLLDTVEDRGTSKYVAKLIDFGEARQMDMEELEMTMKGTPMYVAPEVVLGEEYDHTCDIWSFGITLLDMLTCKNGGVKACWRACSQSGKAFTLNMVTKRMKPKIPETLKIEAPGAVRIINACLIPDKGARIPSFSAIKVLMHSKKEISRRTTLYLQSSDGKDEKIMALERQLEEANRVIGLARRRRASISSHDQPFYGKQ